MVAKIPKTLYDGKVRKIYLLTRPFALTFALALLIYFVSPNSVHATISVTQDPKPVCQDNRTVTLKFVSDANDIVAGADYTLAIWGPGADRNSEIRVTPFWIKPTNKLELEKEIQVSRDFGNYYYELMYRKISYPFSSEERQKSGILSGQFTVFPKEVCKDGLPTLEMPSPVQVGSTVPIKVRNINPASEYLLWFIDGQKFIDGKLPSGSIISEDITDATGNAKTIKTAYFSVIIDKNTPPETKTLCLKHGGTNFLGYGKKDCEISIPIQVLAVQPQVTPTIMKSGEPGTPLEESVLFIPTPTPSSLPPCAQWALLNGATISPKDPIYNNPDFKERKCIAINTAIGEISTEPQGFVKRIFSFVLGIAGGIALILIIISGYRMMASQGNPEALTAARDQLTSAIVGLLFIIFSFVILQVIGVDILKIPGFNP